MFILHMLEIFTQVAITDNIPMFQNQTNHGKIKRREANGETIHFTIVLYKTQNRY